MAVNNEVKGRGLPINVAYVADGLPAGGRRCGRRCRRSEITAALDAGVPLRDVQIAVRHADPRTTTRYDRARNNLDRHASHIVTAFIAGAS